MRKTGQTSGIGEHWTPGELRHTAISVLSHEDMILEDIAGLAGHRNSMITASVYRHNLSPVINSARAPIEKIFGQDRRSG